MCFCMIQMYGELPHSRQKNNSEFTRYAGLLISKYSDAAKTTKTMAEKKNVRIRVTVGRDESLLIADFICSEFQFDIGW
jgi:hypothetical protein